MPNDFMSTQFPTADRAPNNPDNAHGGSLIFRSRFAMLVNSALYIIDRHLSAPPDHTAPLSEILNLQSGPEQK
jgi:hypothetical protein